MKALYNLARYLPSFNFFEWLVQAKGRGATSVVLDVRQPRYLKWSVGHTNERIESICVPGPALAGLPVAVARDTLDVLGTVDIARPGGRELVEFFNAKVAPFHRLATVREPGRAAYTVTLRKTQRSPTRDSNEGAWREFAAKIGAVVIPDYDDEPIHLWDRVALYAGAEMNFFVSNGPGVLCSLTEYPCMLFNTHHARGSLKSDGVGGWGAQYPWMIPESQRAIWEEDTLDNIWRHFERWYDGGQWLAHPDDPALFDDATAA